MERSCERASNRGPLGVSGSRRDPLVDWRLPCPRRPFRPPARPLRVLDPRRGVPDPGARSRGPPSSRCRRSALTDHGSLAGAVDLVKEAKKHGVKPIIGCEVYVADDRKAQQKGYAHLTLLARDERGLLEPDQALEPRLPRGLLLQAARRLGAARAARQRADRALRLPLRPRLQGARGGPRRRRRGRARPAHDDLRQGRRLRRDAERAPRRAAAHQPAARAARRRSAALPTRRDRRRALPPARGRARARGAALHPVGRLAQEPEPLEVRHRPLLLQDAGRRCAPTSPARKRRCAARSRSPSAATSRSSSAASCCRTSRRPTAATRSTTSSSSARRASSGATTRSRPSCASGSSSS